MSDNGKKRQTLNPACVSSQKKKISSLRKSPVPASVLGDKPSSTTYSKGDDPTKRTRSNATPLDLSSKMKMLRRGTSTCLSIVLYPSEHRNIICNLCLHFFTVTCKYNLNLVQDESTKRPYSKQCDRAWGKKRSSQTMCAQQNEGVWIRFLPSAD